MGSCSSRGPLAEAGTREFKVTGSWADPQVSKLERRTPPLAAPVFFPGLCSERALMRSCRQRPLELSH